MSDSDGTPLKDVRTTGLVLPVQMPLLGITQLFVDPKRSFPPHTRLTPTQNSTDSGMKEIAQEPRRGLLERTGISRTRAILD
jgi:hypothetical protein